MSKKYTQEAKEELKRKFLEEFEKLENVYNSTLINAFANNIKEEDKKPKKYDLAIKNKEEKKKIFESVIDSFLQQHDENVFQGFKEVNKKLAPSRNLEKPFMSFKEYVDSLIQDAQKNENVNQGQQNNIQIKEANNNLEQENNEKDIDSRERSNGERSNDIQKEQPNRSNNQDELVVMSKAPDSKSQIQSTDNSLEDDLYSKIMNINLNRAAIIDKELLEQGKDFDGTKKYHGLNEEELNHSKGKLNDILKNSISGLTSFDELDKSTEGKEKLVSLKEFDTSEQEKSYKKLSEAIPFQSTDYKLKDNTKTSEIKSPEGGAIGSLEKTERTIKVDGNDVKVWQAKLNLDGRSNGFDVAAKLYLYDDKGQQSDLSIIIGKDKNGVPVISAQLDIEACKSGNKDDLVTLKREGKTYVMPITYNDYEKYHEAMLNKTQFKDMNLSKNLDKDRDAVVALPNLKASIASNAVSKNSNVAPNNGANNRSQINQH